MIAHIVPETYLKSWKIVNKNNKTYIFDNKNLFCEIKNLNVMSSTFFTSINEYILRYEKCSSYIFKGLFDNLFFELDKKYDIYYNGKKLTKNSLRVFIKSVFLENNIEVFTKQHYKVRNSKLNNDISEYWKKNISDNIESFFNQEYENKWNDFKNYLEYDMQNKKCLKENYYEYIIEFISIQISRQKDKFNKIFQDLVNNKGLTETQSNEYWLIELYKFVTYKNGNNSNKYNLVSFIIDYFKNTNFLIKIMRSDKLGFITSDNPIYYVNDKKSIFFPVSPNICFVIDENSNNIEKNKVLNINIQDDLVKEINKYTLNNSKKNIVFLESKINNLLY